MIVEQEAEKLFGHNPDSLGDAGRAFLAFDLDGDFAGELHAAVRFDGARLGSRATRLSTGTILAKRTLLEP